MSVYMERPAIASINSVTGHLMGHLNMLGRAGRLGLPLSPRAANRDCKASSFSLQLSLVQGTGTVASSYHFVNTIRHVCSLASFPSTMKCSNSDSCGEMGRLYEMMKLSMEKRHRTWMEGRGDS